MIQLGFSGLPLVVRGDTLGLGAQDQAEQPGGICSELGDGVQGRRQPGRGEKQLGSRPLWIPDWLQGRERREVCRGTLFAAAAPGRTGATGLTVRSLEGPLAHPGGRWMVPCVAQGRQVLLGRKGRASSGRRGNHTGVQAGGALSREGHLS